MNNPELYLQIGTKILDQYTLSVLGDYLHRFINGDHGKKTILDIGAGPGHFTYNNIYLPLRHQVGQLIGIDQSEKMVNHANQHYGNELINFRQLNIEKKEVPEEFLHSFDYVFSFWALHFVKDEEQTYINILNMMKPGGDALLLFPASCVLYDVYKKVWNRPRWSAFITEDDFVRTPYSRFQRPQESFSNFLSGVGFKTQECSLSKISLSMSDVEIKAFVASIIPVMDKIPKDFQEDFLEDHLKELFTRISYNDDLLYVLDYNIFVVHAKK
ncbi:hypothetical protein PPYR_08793 [Photinus pyralis]|uniref:Methyltransferase domain-containing protein n=1 Tax=Photinus pyralis TaxID=7054 RepID=A0A1Y1LE44_PHOPY|nr:juvenile hormone acid O-methyltransferase-like [Photinus pyralis]KAB0797800.1 hypothetical protein PPYR_08793 [Photinus pyralis]